MATTFLTLVNLVCNRLNEVNLTTGTFGSTDGAHATIKDSINASIRDIQREYPEWPWNKVNRNFTTSIGVSEYTPASDVNNIDWDTFYVVRDDTHQITAQPLPLIEYTLYAQKRRAFDQQATSDQWAKPQYVIRSQTNTILISPFPNQNQSGNYQVAYEAWTFPQDLSASTDISIVPDRYNSTIVEGALKYMYQFRSDDSAKQMSQSLQEEGIREILKIEIPSPQLFKTTIIPNANSYSWVATRTF